MVRDDSGWGHLWSGTNRTMGQFLPGLINLGRFGFWDEIFGANSGGPICTVPITGPFLGPGSSSAAASESGRHTCTVAALLLCQ